MVELGLCQIHFWKWVKIWEKNVWYGMKGLEEKRWCNKRNLIYLSQRFHLKYAMIYWQYVAELNFKYAWKLSAIIIPMRLYFSVIFLVYIKEGCPPIQEKCKHNDIQFHTATTDLLFLCYDSRVKSVFYKTRFIRTSRLKLAQK